MKKLVKLVRLSSKESFKRLRDLGEIKCNAINKNFKVTNLFLRHISWSSKNRRIRDIIERLTSINLIEKVSSKWKLIETRKKPIIEKYEYKKSYKIKLKISNINFYLILAERFEWEVILISVFINFLE